MAFRCHGNRNKQKINFGSPFKFSRFYGALFKNREKKVHSTKIEISKGFMGPKNISFGNITFLALLRVSTTLDLRVQ